jgi:hypothetical protein
LALIIVRSAASEQNRRRSFSNKAGVFPDDIQRPIPRYHRFLECSPPTFKLSILPRGIRSGAMMLDSSIHQDLNELTANQLCAVIRRHSHPRRMNSQRSPHRLLSSGHTLGREHFILYNGTRQAIKKRDVILTSSCRGHDWIEVINSRKNKLT